MLKKILKLMLSMFMFLIYSNVFAMTLDSTNIELEPSKNKKINLYAEVPDGTLQVEFILVFDSYDIPVVFNPANGINDKNPDGPSHTLVLSESSSGKILLGTVSARVVKSPKVTSAGANIYSAKAIDSDGKKTNLNNQDLTVTVSKKTDNTNDNAEKPIDNNDNKPNVTEKKMLLDKIDSKLVNIQLKENVYEYNVTINENIKELDLVGVPTDKKYKVNISNQKISELVDDKITITVLNDKEEEKYFIKVNVLKNAENVVIDNSEFEVDSGYKSLWIVTGIILFLGLGVGVFLMNKQKY